AAMLNGVKRGLYSNEAGMGSAPNVAAAATPVPHHPSSQGLVQSLGVFIDTLLICSATGFVILLSGVAADGHDGVRVTQQAMTVFFGGAGSSFVAIAMFFFAFTTILGNYSYAENNLLYLGGGKAGLLVLRLAALAVIVWGVYSKVQIVWDAADAAMAIMASINLVAVVMLSGVVVKLTRDYDRQLDAGRSPEFHVTRYPELGDGVDREIGRGRWGATARAQQPGRNSRGATARAVLRRRARRAASVPEVPYPGEHHRDAVLVGGGDGLAVAHRAPGLDHRADAGFGRGIDAIAEREEGVRGHDRAGHLQTGLDRLEPCDLRAHHPAHLSGADAHRATVLRIDDGVGLDELGHPPGKQQVRQLSLVGGDPGDDLQLVGGHLAVVAGLDQ